MSVLQKHLEHLECQQGLSKDNILCSDVCTESLDYQVVLGTIHSLPKQDLLTRENIIANRFQNTWLWEKSMNFTELRIFSFPPLSFSDFCLLFALLGLRKVFAESLQFSLELS